MKTTVTALTLTGAVALAALMGGIGAAEAGGKKGHHFHHWKHHHHHHHFFVPRFDGCGFYKLKWRATGKFYWKERYFICKGW